MVVAPSVSMAGCDLAARRRVTVVAPSVSMAGCDLSVRRRKTQEEGLLKLWAPGLRCPYLWSRLGRRDRRDRRSSHEPRPDAHSSRPQQGLDLQRDRGLDWHNLDRHRDRVLDQHSHPQCYHPPSPSPPSLSIPHRRRPRFCCPPLPPRSLVQRSGAGWLS